mgnify:FL=1
MNKTKDQIQSHATTQVDTIHALASMSGKVAFLASLDLGSITRNDTAQELVQDLKNLCELVDRISQQNS